MHVHIDLQKRAINVDGLVLTSRKRNLPLFVAFLAWRFQTRGVREWVSMEALGGVVGHAHPKQYQRYLNALENKGLHVVVYECRTSGPWRLADAVDDVSFNLSDSELAALFAPPEPARRQNDDALLFKVIERIELNINNKTIVVQYGGNNEMYLKGQDQGGRITTLNDKDHRTIKDASTNLASSTDQNTDIHAEIGKTLNLLDSWPKTLPLLIWRSNDQMISAVDKDKVISAGLDKKGKTKWTEANAIDNSILEKPDVTLQFPDIEPYEAIEAKPESDGLAQPTPRVRITGQPDSNSSISLCKSIGSKVSGQYPKVYIPLPSGGVLSSPPQPIYYGTNSFSNATVGDASCLGRCGAQCMSSLAGVYGFGYNSYSQDCLEHDMCASYYKDVLHPYCNVIFADAADDFVNSQLNCTHDIKVSLVVGSSPSSSSTPSSLSSKSDIYLIYTVQNNGGTKLPHKNVTFEIYTQDSRWVPTPSVKTQLTRELGAYESQTYYYKLGGPGSFRAGVYVVNVAIKADLVETDRSNNFVSRQFIVQ